METEISSSSERRQRNRKEYLRLSLSILVLLLILGSFAFYLAWPLLTGTTVRLATIPVDPFDIFRGQYITINYEINNIPSINGANINENVFVSLNEDENKTWHYEKASLIIPQDGIFIKGKIISNNGNRMSVHYGIEQYFFERDATFPMRNLEVKVKISSEGQARIVELLQNGKPVKISYKNFSLTS